MTADPTADVPTATASRRPLPGWSFPPIGALAALLGLLPWLVTGARLPLQNLWEGAPPDAVFVLLPFSQYAVSLVGALLIVGAVAAGIAGRALGATSPRAAAALLIGVVVVQVAAVVQTALTVRAGLRIGEQSDVYIVGLTAGAMLVVFVGVVVTGLVTRAPRAGALIGLVLGAIALAPWVSALIVPFGSAPAGISPIMALLPWITPVLAGIAIAWTGVDTAGRVAAAVATVLLVWVAPALLTGISSALGTRVYANSPADMLDYGLGVFRMALFIPELALRPIIATVVTATIGLGIRGLLARRSRDDTAAREADPAATG